MQEIKIKCLWCNGKGQLRIGGRRIDCLNCHGSGVGKDGGRNTQSEDNPYLKGNTYASLKRVR